LKQKNRKELIAVLASILLTFIITIIVSIIVMMKKHDKYGVTDAILPWEAYRLRDNKEYFIVGKYSIYDEPIYGMYYYRDGIEKTTILIEGNSPFYELTKEICYSGNEFLIKGYLDKEWGEVIEREILVVEEWDIIAPVKRSYSEYSSAQRLFYPLLYLDTFDVENGHYYNVDCLFQGLTIRKFLYIVSKSEKDCYVVTSDYDEKDDLNWYIYTEGTSKKIIGLYQLLEGELVNVCLTGNTPEPYFGKSILQKRKNQFLLCGTYEQEEGIFNVDQWYIFGGIDRSIDDGHYHSDYYFDQYDVAEKAIILPQ
jgi:hypothetical protein